MSGTGTPYLYLTPTGTIVPDTSDLQTQIENEYLAVFPNLNVSAPETPQGVIITAEVNARAEVVANNAALANQINPNIAGGIFLQSICALLGIPLPTATNTIVPGVTLTGQPNLPIPAGVLAQTVVGSVPTGNFFQTTEAVTLNSSGIGTVDFESVDVGPVPCDPGTLTKITTNVLGWETVTNSGGPDPLGSSPPTDAELRAIRNSQLAYTGLRLSEAIISAVAAVPGVLGPPQFLENITNSTATIDGISLVAKSIWCCVQGGDNNAVAWALLTAKSGGCAWNGGVSVPVVDPSSGQTYTVLFDRPTAIPVLCNITVVLPNAGLSSTDVVAAILAFVANQLSNQPGFTTGVNASPFGISGAVVSQIPGVVVSDCELALASSGPPPSFSPAQIVIAKNQIATLAGSGINVTATYA